MKDDADRTRIKSRGKAPSTAAKPHDATRIQPQQSPRTSSANDATRIAPAKDKTRIALTARRPAASSAQTTRFRTDATRKAGQPSPPLKTDSVDFPTHLESAEDDTQPNLQQVLKKRFVLEEVLGAGGMGVVYKARDLLKVEAQDRDPYVAIKVLSEEFKTHPEAFISLQRESRKSQRIAHPNIVNVYDFDRDGDTVFMTMEFLDGSPLDDLIHQYQATGLPTDDAWEIIFGMTSALSHAHAEQIIHSDFKPGNVFVTGKGVAKVFDFGIARAVAQVEHLESNPEDKTLFDAGTLGALTPAYASLEMLEGAEPDVRDDIYALGCVAYEMLTGRHPFNKMPADEAERQGLKPKRIGHIKSYQWKAIEKALAFRRKDRMETIDQFISEISPDIKTANRGLIALVIFLLAGIAGYYFYLQQLPEAPEFSEFDIRNELELQVRIDFFKENILAQINSAEFTEPWQDALWKNVSDLTTLTRGQDPWVSEHNSIIYQLYRDRITATISSADFVQARLLVKNAARYSQQNDELQEFSEQIAAAIKRQKNRQQLAARQQEKEQQARLAREKEQAAQQQKQQQALAQQKQQQQQFDVALDNLRDQLRCQGGLNMRNFETAISKLQQLDAKKYAGLKQDIISSLAGCIQTIGVAFPQRAVEARKQALRIFPSDQKLSAITIKSRDPCDTSLAGLGSRGKRAVCKDKLKISGSGPELVVIPGNNKLATFAIGKYEVTIAQMNQFCKQSSICQPDTGSEGDLPVTTVGIDDVRAYLKWLSEQSGQRYRLPSKNEWLYAARSRQKSLDPNRNCELRTRGFEKGGALVKSDIGRQNSWGLVNYVGNAQEFVYDSGRKLLALGGSYKQAMESCDINTSRAHNGLGDTLTGFRVVREISAEL